jgi:ArsR family transcriptional regulator, zinc-responsive transcriptional repressor
MRMSTLLVVRDLARLEPAVELLKALAAPVRLALIEELAGGPCCVHELVDRLAVSQPLVSQHLRVLRTAGLVTAGRRGREVEYALADDHVSHVVLDLLRHADEPVPAGVPVPPENPPHEESA